MTKKIQNILIDSLYEKGYFSEYLPEEFDSSDFKNLKNNSLDSTDEKPYTYTMNKNDTSLERRTISIPEIGSYINVIKYIESTDIFNRILSLSAASKKSLSKILTKRNTLRTFSNPYRIESIPIDQKDEEDFIGNTIIKIKKASGSVGILKLDIANFYGSFYTHNITCIEKGFEWAEDQYRRKEQDRSTEYISLNKLDSIIGKLNQKRTHGLLIGPLVSFLIAEGLMCTIDDELSRELKDRLGKNIDFVRFIDDYDVFIKEEEDIPLIILTFTKVLEKYGFVLGDGKTEYIKFPFYVYENFKEVLEPETKSTSSKKLLNIYSKLANLNLYGKQKGGLFFLASNMEQLSDTNNYQEATSLLLSIIKENAKSIPVACKTLIKICNTHKEPTIVDAVFDDLSMYLKRCLEKQYEWEQIWLIYTLININSKKLSLLLPEYFKARLSELAIIMIINEITDLNSSLLIENLEVYSWLLKYELYRKNILLTDESMADYISDSKVIENFKKLKLINCKLYSSTVKK